MIEIRNINKTFSERKILKDINLNINKSEVIAIIGPSGTGKSTFLRCINYLEKPESGTIKFGHDLYNFSKVTKEDIYNLRQKSSMVFQSYALFKNMNVLENVTLHLSRVKNLPKEKAISKAKYFLAKVNLLDKVDSFPSQLSGGQQQRVGIARAMAIESDLMLLDEPTSSLDPELVRGILNLIEELVLEGQTMIIVTHEMEFAKQVADRIVFMNQGEIWEINTSTNIFENPQTPELKQFLNNLI